MPQLNLVLGANINPNSIIEGSDVYTECHIRSNPPVYEVTWLFEGEPLYSDRSKGIIIANQTLVLQRIKKSSRGNYQCIGRNEIGIGKSNPLFLRVQCKYNVTEYFSFSFSDFLLVFLSYYYYFTCYSFLLLLLQCLFSIFTSHNCKSHFVSLSTLYLMYSVDILFSSV